MTSTDRHVRRLARARQADREALSIALTLADGDEDRLEVADDGRTVVVRNRPPEVTAP